MCTSASNILPSNFQEAVDPHKYRTGKNSHERHKDLGLAVDIPQPPAVAMLQAARNPDTAPLTRRKGGGAGVAVPYGSTMLSGAGGVGSYNLGGGTLLGGG